MHLSGYVLGIALSLTVAGCGEDTATLFVDLRTDLVPVQEFAAVRVRVEQTGAVPRVVESIASRDDDFLGGRRILEGAGLAPAGAVITVELVAVGDLVVQSRTTRTTLSASENGITVVMSRDCGLVTCPSSAEDPTLAACLGSRCVVPECTEEMPDLCGEAECASDSECRPSTACATGVCVAGACLFDGHDERCSAGEYCDADIGCAPEGPPGPWAPAVELTELIVDDTEDDDDPSLTGDMLELVFERAGGLRTSTRDSIDDPWSSSQPVRFVDDGLLPGNHSSPELSLDGLTLYYSVSSGLATTTEMYRTTRASRAGVWAAPAALTGVNIPDEADYAGPPTPDGRHLFFVRSTPTRFRDIFVASRATPADDFGDVLGLTGVNGDSADDGPSFVPAQSELWFSSERSGNAELYRSTIDLVALSATPPIADPDPELNTSAGERDPWLHPSGRVLFFSRTVGGGITRLFWTSR